MRAEVNLRKGAKIDIAVEAVISLRRSNANPDFENFARRQFLRLYIRGQE
jgi:hypothetical protein